jgi:hypothetical protein
MILQLKFYAKPEQERCFTKCRNSGTLSGSGEGELQKYYYGHMEKIKRITRKRKSMWCQGRKELFGNKMKRNPRMTDLQAVLECSRSKLKQETRRFL